MENNAMKRFVRCAAFGSVALVAIGGAAMAQDKSAQNKVAPAAASALPIKDERALKMLKAMSDTLSKAKTASFDVRGLVPAAAPTGQHINLLASSRVVMQRPDKLFVEARGDMFPSDIYFNGKTVTVMSRDKKFYVQQPATGAGYDTFAEKPQPGADAIAPFFDMLGPDPYATLTKDFATALLVGQSTIAGVKVDHLAFTGKGVDWEIWIGAADKLPRLMVISYRVPERQRTFTVEFSNWKLNPAVSAQTFSATIPPGAAKLEFRPEVSLPTK